MKTWTSVLTQTTLANFKTTMQLTIEWTTHDDSSAMLSIDYQELESLPIWETNHFKLIAWQIDFNLKGGKESPVNKDNDLAIFSDPVLTTDASCRNKMLDCLFQSKRYAHLEDTCLVSINNLIIDFLINMLFYLNYDINYLMNSLIKHDWVDRIEFLFNYTKFKKIVK